MNVYTTRHFIEHGEIVDYNEAGQAIYKDGFSESIETAIIEAHHHDEDIATIDAWEERFGSHVDSKPHGPQAISMDIAMKGEIVYGIPEHATSLALKPTRGADPSTGAYKDPYRVHLNISQYSIFASLLMYTIYMHYSCITWMYLSMRWMCLCLYMVLFLT